MLQLSLRFAKEYFEMLCEMQKTYTTVKIQESKKLMIIQRALWTSLIIEIGRMFDDYKRKEVISFKKIESLKKDVDNIFSEVIIQKIINTRHTFTAHLGKEKNEVVTVAEICNSKLGKLLDKLDKLLTNQK